MKKVFVLSKKRTLLSIMLVCAMLFSICFAGGTVTASALTQPAETVTSWQMTSDLATSGNFSVPYYAMLTDPVNSKDGKVLAINARANQHNHGLGRPLAFNDGTNAVALAAGKYTVSYKYYLEALEDGFYTIECTTGNCNNTIAGYNDGTSASDYEVYFGVASNTESGYSKTAGLVSKSNLLFSYEAAKTVNFQKYGWQNGTVSFVVTEEMVENDNNIFAIYQQQIGHKVYLKDITVTPYSETNEATDYGMISDFTANDTLPATDSSASAAAMSVDNKTNSLDDNQNMLTAKEIEVPKAGTQSVLAICFSSYNRAMPLNTGFSAKDYMTLKSGTEYQISFDFYNPNYANYDTSWSPVLKLTNLSSDSASVTAAADKKGIAELLSAEDIKGSAATNGYVKVVRNFTVSEDTTVDRLALYTYCAETKNYDYPYYIDNIQIVETNNTAVFDLGNDELEIDNITVTYGDAIYAPESDIYAKVSNISGWRDAATGDVFTFGSVIPKYVTARYVGSGETTVFNAVYDKSVTFDFNTNYSVPNTVSGKAAVLDSTTDESNVSIAFTQQNADRHFVLYGQNGSDTITALASYEKYRTYKVTFDYKCTELGDGKPQIYVAMGVQHYKGTSTTDCLYKSTVLEVTEVSDGWNTVTAYVMAPGSYDTNTNEDIQAFNDGKYIALGLSGKQENETASKVLFDNVTVEAESFMLGDLNNDLKINATDLASIRTHLIGTATLADTVNADVRKDGEVNILDLVRLKKYLAMTN